MAVKPYKKPLDRNTYLNFDSFHLAYIRRNLPLGQFLRLKRTSTQQQDYTQECRILIQQLQQRGYPDSIIQRAHTRADNTPRESLLKGRNRDRDDRLI